MITVCSSSPVNQRIHYYTRKLNCNNGLGSAQTFCYGFRTTNHEQENDIRKCLDKLYDLNKINSHFGRHSENVHRCRCTVESNRTLKWKETFEKARINLYEQCCGFSYHVMGQYEDNMRLTITCN